MKLPKGWTLHALGDHIELLTGFPFESARYSGDLADIKLLRGDNIVQNGLRWDDVKRWCYLTDLKLDRYHLRAGDLVLAMDRPWTKAGLKYAVVKTGDLPCLLVQRVSRIRGGSGLCSNFAAQLIGSHRFTAHVKGVQTETAIPHISSEQIRNFPVSLPPLPEQRKIADILSTWDEAIEKLDSLIAVKDRRKTALTQQLLTGKKRFRAFGKKEWKKVRMNELLERAFRPIEWSAEMSPAPASTSRNSSSIPPSSSANPSASPPPSKNNNTSPPSSTPPTRNSPSSAPNETPSTSKNAA